MPDQLQRDLYSAREIAAACNLAPTTVYAYMRTGRISTVQVGRAVRVRADEYRRFLDQLPPGRPPVSDRRRRGRPEPAAA